MITFALENWADYHADCQELWKEHYAELCTRQKLKPMSPDVPYFQFLESRGMLQVLTARKRGVMVGYCLIVVKRHTHYSILAGFEDSYFLTAAERKGGVGLRMITRALGELRKRGVQEVYFMSKNRFGMEKLFERMGFEATDQVWTKWLGLAPMVEN